MHKKILALITILNCFSMLSMEKPSAPTPVILRPVTMPAKPAPQATAAIQPHKLVNVGNSCFMNAALQSLSSLDALTQATLNSAQIYIPGSVAAIYVQFLLGLQNPAQQTINALPLCMASWTAMGLPAKTAQDSEEFLRMLLNHSISIDVDPVKTMYGYMSPLARLINFSLKTLVEGNAPRTNQDFMISLMPMSAKLTECLDAYFTPEEVEYKGTLAFKTSVFCQLNKYVIISLKRKIYNTKAKSFTKISKPVSFPLDNLNLQPYTDQSFISSPYRLKAFIIHNGNANGGHYSAYVRLGEQWYLCDDTYILAVPTAAIAQMASRGYASTAEHTPVIFFYEMQNN